MDALDWVCKLLAFPFFIAGLAVSMPCLEFLFWLDDNREMKWKALRQVKQCFLDIIEGVRDYAERKAHGFSRGSMSMERQYTHEGLEYVLR